MAKRASARLARAVRGQVVTHRRRCGKVNCRCAAGEQNLHEETVFTYSERGRTRSVTLPADEVAPVRAAVAAYKAELTELEATGEAGREALLARLAARRSRR